MITQERLKEVLHYDPNTGLFRWRYSRHGAKINQVAGTSTSRGYVNIRIDGTVYGGHRLAWLYTHGYFPESDISFKNKDRSDVRINNLVVISRLCGMRRIGNSKRNTSGVRGVSGTVKRGWVVKIRANGKENYLGKFKCFAEAVCCRLAAEQAVDWEGCYDSSPAYQYVKNNIQGGMT
jgi:hypothetical protein